MGGKTFKDKQGNPEASRIPTRHLKQLEIDVVKMFHQFAEFIEMVTCQDILPKETHGDIDFVILSLKNGRENIRKLCQLNGYKTFANGPMEHILYKFKPEHEASYNCQIDLIFSENKVKYETLKYFYSKPSSFNSVVGHYARSLGYKFSVDGFLLHATDKRKQNRYIKLTDDLSRAYYIMYLNEPDNDFIFDSPENFASWIMSSPRFDTKSFTANYNMKAHRDTYNDDFCAKVYKYCNLCDIKSKIPITDIDFSKESKYDFKELLIREKEVLGEDIYDKIVEQIDEWSKKAIQIISGKEIMDLGIPQGPLIGKIIDDVSSKFTLEDKKEDIIEYILRSYK